VYIKPESKRLKDLEPSFSKSGDQGDRWYQGYVPLPTNLFENFQVCSFDQLHRPQKINRQYFEKNVAIGFLWSRDELYFLITFW